jgi:hypothetical protein
VLSGANDTGVASNIRRALSTQLDAQRFNVIGGDGANVLVTNAAGSSQFFVELIDSDVENVSVRVQDATTAVTPTVPMQQVPAIAPTPPTPPEPGNALPPASTPVPASPSSPPAGGEAGSSASAPPPG